VVQRVIVVAQVRATAHTTGPFTGAHAWALSTRGVRSTVVVDEGADVEALVPAEVVTLSSGASEAARFSALVELLSDAVTSSGHDAVVVNGDAAWVAQLARPLRAAGARVLWWTPTFHVPEPDEIATMPVDGVLTVFPVVGVPAGAPRAYPMGAGVDTRSFPPGAPPVGWPPLQLLCSGAVAASELATVERALTLARAQGVDAQLTVVGGAASADRPAGATHHPAPMTEREVRRYHAVVEPSASGCEPLVLAALATGRPVISANALTDQLVGHSPALLRFVPGDVELLARRVAALWFMAPRQHVARGVVLHEAVDAGHSIDVWADRLAAVLDEQPHLAIGSGVPVGTGAPRRRFLRRRARVQATVAAACLALGATVWAVAPFSTGGDDSVSAATQAAAGPSGADPGAPGATGGTAATGSSGGGGDSGSSSSGGTGAGRSDGDSGRRSSSGSRGSSSSSTKSSGSSSSSSGGSSVRVTVAGSGSGSSSTTKPTSTTSKPPSTTKAPSSGTLPPNTSAPPPTTVTAPPTTTPPPPPPPPTEPPTTAPPPPPPTEAPTTTEPPPPPPPPSTDPPADGLLGSIGDLLGGLL
jgi:hypothetical protein